MTDAGTGVDIPENTGTGGIFMKLSSKALACGQSPMRKFHPYAVAAAAAGKKIYHLNIGQPDIHTPDALYDAIHSFRTPVLAYAASPGIPELIEAIRKYYEAIGVGLDEADILITAGGRSRQTACWTTATRSSSPSRSTRITTRSSRPPAALSTPCTRSRRRAISTPTVRASRPASRRRRRPS